VDRDLNGNFAFGGISNTQDIVASPNRPNAFLLLMDKDGNIKWSTQFDDNYNTVEAIAFSPDG
jgi:hypothetical protein